MKQLLLLPLLSIFLIPGNGPLPSAEKSPAPPNEANALRLQPEPENMKMLAVEFKTREWCRAELKDFEYNIHFSIVSATVYFTGTNFKSLEKGFITSNSLKPISALMARCAPGSIVIFDDVKVKGPDNEVRTIQGKTIVLH